MGNCYLLHFIALEQSPEKFVYDDDYRYYAISNPNRKFACDCSPCRYNEKCDESSANCSSGLAATPCAGSAVFPTKILSDYIISEGGQEMTAITACAWVKILEISEHPNFISYAVEKDSNMFVFSMPSSLYVTIKGISRFTKNPFPGSYGVWHALCITWTSNDGNYTFYINGTMFDGGKGFMVGSRIDGNGAWILGHDQDSYKGGFQKSQMLVGEIAEVNIWDKVLSEQEVKMYSSVCNQTLIGNVKSWEDFKQGIQGNVAIDDNPSCCNV